MPVGVPSTRPPELTPIGNQTPTASQVGSHSVTFSVSDGNGGSDSETIAITVEDRTPPAITSVTADPSTLWPPNQRMVAVTVTVAATDAADPAPKSKIVSVSSSDPDDGKGDGKTSPDVNITGDLTVELRAERVGPNKERVCTITVECVDSSGDRVTAQVPRDQSPR